MDQQVIERFNFFTALYRHCDMAGGNLEHRQLPSKRQQFIKVADAATTEFSEKQNNYFAVALRNGGGTKEDITQIPAVFVDVDYKDLPADEVERRLAQLPFKPTVRNSSGGGQHGFWRLTKPATPADIPSIERVNRGLVAFLGGDNGATDASRILRIPGTLNLKYTPPRVVTTIELNPEREYELAELERFFDQFSPVPEAKKPEAHKGSATSTGDRPGDDYNRRTTYADMLMELQSEGWAVDAERDDRLYLRRPGKTEGSSATLFKSGLFYVFSSNAAPFKEFASFSAFAVRAMLKHGGDYKAAARALGQQGKNNAKEATETPYGFKFVPSAECGTAECFLEVLTDADDDSTGTYEWLVDRLVPKGEPMILGGKGSSGKSTLALELAARIMESDPEAGVVYICAEGTYRDTKIKARQMGLTRLNRFFFLKRKKGGTSFKLSEKEDLPLVTEALETAQAAGHKIVFVVIDSIQGMHRGNMNEDAVGEVMQAINAEFCGRLGITVCYIHHSKKNTKDGAAMDLFLGSVSIVNAIRYGLFMVKKTNRLREVEVAKSNLGHDDIFFNAELTPDHRVSLTYAGIRGDEADQADLSQLDKADEIILSMLLSGEAVPAYLIYGAGEQQGISDRTMKAAKKLRHVDCFQDGKRWMWRLPASELKKMDSGNGVPPVHPEPQQIELINKVRVQTRVQSK
jgi:hypothetical protein